MGSFLHHFREVRSLNQKLKEKLKSKSRMRPGVDSDKGHSLTLTFLPSPIPSTTGQVTSTVLVSSTTMADPFAAEHRVMGMGSELNEVDWGEFVVAGSTAVAQGASQVCPLGTPPPPPSHSLQFSQTPLQQVRPAREPKDRAPGSGGRQVGPSRAIPPSRRCRAPRPGDYGRPARHGSRGVRSYAGKGER